MLMFAISIVPQREGAHLRIRPSVAKKLANVK